MTAEVHRHRFDLQLHLPLVRSIASRIHRRLPKEVELDDLVSEGTVGLIAAANAYDAERSVPFEAYATPRIKGAIVDALRGADWVPRSVRGRARRLDDARETFRRRSGRTPDDTELASELDLEPERLGTFKERAQVCVIVSIDAPTSTDAVAPIDRVADEDPDVLHHLLEEERRRAVIAAVRALPERERTVVSLYYFHGLTLKEIGRTLGVTESRACQLRSGAIRLLRQRLAALRA